MHLRARRVSLVLLLLGAVAPAACSQGGDSSGGEPGAGGKTASGGQAGSASSGGRSGGGSPSSSGGAGAGAGGATGAAGSGGAGTSSGGAAGGAEATGGATGSPPDAAGTGDGPAPAPDDAGPTAPGAFPGCPGCKSIFNGTTLDGWVADPAGAFEVKAGAIASTGKGDGRIGGANLWTKDDYGNYRIIYSARHVKGGHQACTIVFGNRPANGKSTRGMNGIQFQPPNAYSYDYRPGGGNPTGAPKWVYPAMRTKLDAAKWNRCELLVKASGEFRSACCEIEGKTTCKGEESLHYTDATAGKAAAPWAIMMHDVGGLFDEYKDIWVETNPAVDDLITTK